MAASQPDAPELLVPTLYMRLWIKLLGLLLVVMQDQFDLIL